ncbi:MAG: carbohydrate kinase family protein [bacterium]
MKSSDLEGAEIVRRGIASGGNWVIDHVKIIDHWPSEETLAAIGAESLGTGGAPYNVLVNLAKLAPDLPLEAVGLVGEDADGERILEDCRRFKINPIGLHKSSVAGTSYTDVMTVRSTGRRTFFHYRGANDHLEPAHFPIADLKAKIFHLGYISLLEKLDAPDPETGIVAARVLRDLRAAGLRVSVDAVSVPCDEFAARIRAVLPHTDYLLLNELEAGWATGLELRGAGGIPSAKNVEKAAKNLLAGGVHQLVCIHFPEGAFAIARTGVKNFQPSLQLPDGYIKGSVGAGDAFVAGMLYGLHEDWTLSECLRLATAAAAVNLGDATSTGRMFSVAETLQTTSQFPFRKII